MVEGGVVSSNSDRVAVSSASTSKVNAQEGNSISTPTKLNISVSSGAPTPPSLDSLHQMTKSQTSSEGDRLSDRHLASPEYAGIELTGLSPAWGSRSFLEGEEDSSGSLAEDGYSTLKRVNDDIGSPGRDQERGAGASHFPVHPGSRNSDHFADFSTIDKEPETEAQLSHGYTTVKDTLSSEDLTVAAENDPNYESVDEARAKLRLLYRTDKRVEEESETRGAILENRTRNNVTVVKVLHPVKSTTVPSPSKSCGYLIKEHEASKSKPSNTSPRQRPNHDYEELDLSLPSSPSDQPTSPSIRAAGTPTQSLAEAKLQLARSHMYEDISEVRLQSSKRSESSDIYSVPFQKSSLSKTGPSEPHPLSPVVMSATSESTTVMMPETHDLAQAGLENGVNVNCLGTASSTNASAKGKSEKKQKPEEGPESRQSLLASPAADTGTRR
ncbi:hypothetical protein ElyMa_004725000 [Elysia marginata]|uniref:Uncharacterized protein n=1 Tax=Elysia marginata TaxID=1093978 RepID=A0AAV4IB88_9GAST|nr:hypothetical protein ElyMa_004725000 [Elysia marginata]